MRFSEVLELAESEGIDASYLWLARILDLALVTLNGRLAKAAAEKPRGERGLASTS